MDPWTDPPWPLQSDPPCLALSPITMASLIWAAAMLSFRYDRPGEDETARANSLFVGFSRRRDRDRGSRCRIGHLLLLSSALRPRDSSTWPTFWLQRLGVCRAAACADGGTVRVQWTPRGTAEPSTGVLAWVFQAAEIEGRCCRFLAAQTATQTLCVKRICQCSVLASKC